jgi:hypothetical protein
MPRYPKGHARAITSGAAPPVQCSRPLTWRFRMKEGSRRLLRPHVPGMKGRLYGGWALWWLWGCSPSCPHSALHLDGARAACSTYPCWQRAQSRTGGGRRTRVQGWDLWGEQLQALITRACWPEPAHSTVPQTALRPANAVASERKALFRSQQFVPQRCACQ